MRGRALAAIAAAILAGCMTGQDYERPAIDTPAQFQYATTGSVETADTAWWKAFGDPVLELALPPETRSALEDLMKALPRDVFVADDSLGWVYQYWQADRKEEVNRSEKKIGADELPAVRNFNVAVRESGEDVVFLHRLQPGGADRSYGIEVGRLAGLPSSVIQRARAVLRLLEGEQLVAALSGSALRPQPADVKSGERPAQLGLFHDAHPVVDRLRSLDTNRMTPMEALATLDELAREARHAEASS